VAFVVAFVVGFVVALVVDGVVAAAELGLEADSSLAGGAGFSGLPPSHPLPTASWHSCGKS